MTLKASDYRYQPEQHNSSDLTGCTLDREFRLVRMVSQEELQRCKSMSRALRA